MKGIFIFLLSVMLWSCSSSKNQSIGPLTDIKNFEVSFFFSPYEKFDNQSLMQAAMNAFKEVGIIKFVDKESSNYAQKPMLLLTLGGYDSKGNGSLHVIGEVKIMQNGFRMSCPIWEIDQNGKKISYPSFQNDEVVFSKNPSIVKKEVDLPEDVIKKMITDFAAEHRKNNPDGSLPIFYLTHLPK